MSTSNPSPAPPQKGLKRLSLLTPRHLQLTSDINSPSTTPVTSPSASASASPSSYRPTSRPVPKRFSSLSYSNTSKVDLETPTPNSGASLRSAPLQREPSSEKEGSKSEEEDDETVKITPERRSSLHLSRTPGLHSRSPSLAAPRRSLDEARSPPVLTLAEKHADLLHFIAQKESKCLDLRTQLAQHEADLLALKRTWERIVWRASFPSDATPPPPTPASAVSPGVGEVVGAIKEGVQGIGRMLAMGGLAIGGPEREQPSPSPSARSATMPDASPLLSSSSSPLPSDSSHVSSPSVSSRASTASSSGSRHSSLSSLTSASSMTSVAESESDVTPKITPVPTGADLSSLSKQETKVSTVGGSYDDIMARRKRRTMTVGLLQTTGAESSRPSSDKENDQVKEAASESSWLSTANRKLEDVQKSQAPLTGHQKRMSLLSDVSSSLLASFQSFSSPSTQTPTRVSRSSKASYTPLDFKIPPPPRSRSSTSILDEEVEEENDSLGLVMKPDSNGLAPSGQIHMQRSGTNEETKPMMAGDDEDDTWNW